MIHWVRLIYFLGFLLLYGCKNKATPPIPGYYGDDLLVAVEPIGHLITGAYELNHNEGNFDENCHFYFSGKFTGRKTNLVRWSYGKRDVDNVYGVMEIIDDHTFSFYWQERLQDCKSEPDFRSKELLYHCTEKKKWRFIRSVRADLATIHAEPDPETIVLDTIYKNDLVKVLEKREKWIRVESVRPREVQGWISKQHLRPFPG